MSFVFLPFSVFWFFLGFFMWKKEIIGGADVKILTILPLYQTFGIPNIFAGQFFFLCIFGITGTIYGLFGQLIQKKKKIPFIPIITLTFLISKLFLLQ